MKDARKIGKPLSGTPEGDELALGGVEGFGTTLLSAIADLQGMTRLAPIFVQLLTVIWIGISAWASIVAAVAAERFGG